MIGRANFSVERMAACGTRLQIRTSGATHEQIDAPNVLFLGSKIKTMQRLIAEVPEGSEDS